jgi:hypothetical protein
MPRKFVTRPGIIIITACRYKVSYVCERGIKKLCAFVFLEASFPTLHRNILLYTGEPEKS